MKTLELRNYIIFLWYIGLSPLPPPFITPGRALGGSQFILKAKLTSFLKSPLLKTLELIYHINLLWFIDFNPPGPP